ncbi:MAG: hypothetical protein LUF82_00390 [Clostridia bacterium]|nr:hypothetical protein [Clostridia bacterium]
MEKPYGKGVTPAKEIAYAAIMAALLIGGQLALSCVAGVEIVTVLLCCFSFVFGRRSGVLAATAFSLLRCCIWGFYPNVVILYLLYYPLFAFIFGSLGKVKQSTYENFPIWAVILADIAFAAVMVFCALFAATGLLKISRLAKTMVITLLWVVFGLAAALFIVFNVLVILRRCGRVKSADTLKVVLVTAVAAVCTICFSLLDDVVTPLVLGWGFSSATTVTYFYGSFIALAPQTVCTIVTVATLFLPLTAVLKKLKR